MKQQVKIGGIYNDRTLPDNCIVLVARKDGIIFGVDVEGVQEYSRDWISKRLNGMYHMHELDKLNYWLIKSKNINHMIDGYIGTIEEETLEGLFQALKREGIWKQNTSVVK